MSYIIHNDTMPNVYRHRSSKWAKETSKESSSCVHRHSLRSVMNATICQHRRRAGWTRILNVKIKMPNSLNRWNHPTELWGSFSSNEAWREASSGLAACTIGNDTSGSGATMARRWPINPSVVWRLGELIATLWYVRNWTFHISHTRWSSKRDSREWCDMHDDRLPW